MKTLKMKSKFNLFLLVFVIAFSWNRGFLGISAGQLNLRYRDISIEASEVNLIIDNTKQSPGLPGLRRRELPLDNPGASNR
jgi:hypothetical protein